MRKILFVLFIITCSKPCSIYAQASSNIGDTVVNAKLLSASYTLQFPFAELADRFGNNNNIGGSFYFKMPRNFLAGVEGNYIFGGNIKEDTIIDDLFTSQGFLIGINGLAESVILFERGFTLWGKFGKILPLLSPNPNSGLNIILGAGFLQHKIKIEDPSGVVPYVTGDYEKGYDRLTNGFAISQYIGYVHLDKRKLINFNAGIEVAEGFTQNRRDFNFDQMKKDDSKRLDILLGLKVAWILPLYGKGEQRFYTY